MKDHQYSCKIPNHKYDDPTRTDKSSGILTKIEIGIKLKVRLAHAEDMQQVHLMGYDVWSDGRPIDRYSFECEQSEKYKLGTWYVLASKDRLLSSLVIYQGSFDLPDASFGLGSIATEPAVRGKGYARFLLEEIMEQLRTHDPSCSLYLFSDIAPRYYEQSGFVKLPAQRQPYKATVCMIAPGPNVDLETCAVPTYF